MSNFNNAINLLSSAKLPGRTLHPLQVEDTVLTLLLAGLLAPDLPEPYSREEETAYWYEDTYGIGVGRLTKNSPVRVMLWDSEPGGVLYTNVESARDYALKILAACEYAEKEKENE